MILESAESSPLACCALLGRVGGAAGAVLVVLVADGAVAAVHVRRVVAPNVGLLPVQLRGPTLFARPVVGDVGVASVVLDAVAGVLEPPVRLRALEERLRGGRDEEVLGVVAVPVVDVADGD